jgi:hypothetical protein
MAVTTTLHYAIYSSADPDPSAASDVSNPASTWATAYAVATGSEASPTSSGGFAFSTPASGLADGTYKAAIVWTGDGGYVSNIAISPARVVGGTVTVAYEDLILAGAPLAYWRLGDTAGAYSLTTDTFEDLANWVTWTQGDIVQAQARVTGGQLSFDIEGPDGLSSSANAGVFGRFAFPGDFDIQVDVASFAPAPGASLYLRIVIDGVSRYIGFLETSAGVKQFVWSVGSHSSTSRTNTSGGMRFIRSGTTLTAQVKDGAGSWTTLGSGSITTGAMLLDLFGRLDTVVTTARSEQFLLDNFTVNSGSIVACTADELANLPGLYAASTIPGFAAIIDSADTAADFNGTTHYADCTLMMRGTLAHPLNGVSALTVEGWITGDSAAANQKLLEIGASSTALVNLAIRSGGSIYVAARPNSGETLVAVDGGAGTIDFTPYVGRGTHVAATIDFANDTLQLYLDGVLVLENTSAGWTATSLTTADTYRIGCTTGGTEFFDGTLDELALYPRVLTPFEVYLHSLLGRSADAQYDADVQATKPVARWRLGEASGTTAVDAVGSNDGTYVNAPTMSAPGLVVNDLNTAVSFAAAGSEHMLVADAPELDFDGDFTVECIINTSTTSPAHLVRRYDASATAGYAIFLQDPADPPAGTQLHARAVLWISGAAYTLFSDGVINDGKTHIIHAGRSGANVFLYVDGKSQGTTAALATAISITAGLYLGGDPAIGFEYTGTADELALYDHALSAERIMRRAVCVFGGDYAADVHRLAPVAYLRLGETSGTTASDEIGSNDGTYTGGYTLSAPGIPGAVGNNAVGFDGVDGQIDGLPLQMADTYTAFSIEFWFRHTMTTRGTFYSEGNNSNATPYLYINTTGAGNGLTVYWRNDATTAVGITHQNLGLNDDQWHHAVLVQEAANLRRLYVDGVASDTTDTTDIGTITLNTATIAMLSRGGSSEFPLNGYLDEFSFHGRALSADEVADRFLRGKGIDPYAPLTYYEDVMTLAPLAYWRLDEDTGATAVDEVSAAHGTISGIVTLASPALIGSGASMNFGGGKIQAPAVGSLAAWSACLWFKAETITVTTSAGPHLFTNDLGGWNDDVLLGISPEGTSVYTANRIAACHQCATSSVRTIVEDTADTIPGKTYFVALVADGSTLYLYVDGVLKDSTAKAGTTLNFGNNGIVIGFTDNTFDADRDFDGDIDEPVLFNHALTAAQVQALYRKGKYL